LHRLDYGTVLIRMARATRLLIEHRFMMRATRPRDASKHIEEGLKWIARAQDATPDDGVSKGFALNRGWLPSYVETTGYIIPTMFDGYRFTQNDEYRHRAVKMAQWLLSRQLESGAFPGCETEASGKALVFDTGMVVFGLVGAYRETGDERFKKSAERAGDWLVGIQCSSGAWERHTLNGKPRAYHTRVAWSLLELFGISGKREYSESAMRNLDWALTQQRPNGWFENNTFYQESRALTHTICYAARGLLESGMILGEEKYIGAAKMTADRLLMSQDERGALAGRFGRNWDRDLSFSCLSGNAQAGVIWYRLFECTKDRAYVVAAKRAGDFLRQTQDLTSKVNGIRGGIRSCDPIYRGYIKLFYSNWAVKFFIDLLLQQEHLV
jgi:uncharacterized protein YyaL (SSP411 family)